MPLLVLLAAPSFLMAETVMVSIGGMGLPDDPCRGYNFCFSAIESGIMDAFFDAGHIVFNDDGFRSSEDFYRTVLLAREGGAQTVVFIDCFFEANVEQDKRTQAGQVVSLPQKIVISYVRASDAAVIRKAELLPSETDAQKFPFIEDYYALLGRKVFDSLF